MDSERKSTLILGAVFAASLLLHGGAWGVLGLLPPMAALMAELENVEIEIMEEVLPPPEPGPGVEPEPEPEPEPVVEPEHEPVRPRERPEPVDEPPPPPEEPPPPVEEQIADFTGETLTVEGPGTSWQSATGNGEDMQGPIGAPTGVVTGRRRQGGQEGVVGGTGQGAVEEVVSVRDLREPPQPPEDSRFVEAIRRRYPTRLRGLSIEGRAVVVVRIRANGALGRVAVRSSSEPEFGQACVEAVREVGAWQAGIGSNGEPAATDIRFTCDFALAF